MLERFIIHLKNIIFFKLVMYFLLILILAYFIQNFNQDYIKSMLDSQNAQESLTEETLKLYSIINSKNKILKTYKEYTKLLNIPPIQNCLKRIKIINSISTISNKYNLAEPIDTTMTQSFLNTNKKKDTIEIKNYDVNLKFAAPNFPTLLAIIKDAYSYMPKNSVVISIQIQQQTLLEPKIIYKLSTERYPDLIYTKLNMRIREITISK